MADRAPAVRWALTDLEGFPDDETKRYEIIDGELFVSTQPHVNHQLVCTQVIFFLTGWNNRGRPGVVIPAPGIIFSESDAVAPDVVWVSRERLAAILRPDGHLYGPPELVVEVLSPGATNERRDRDAKLKLYSLYGVGEYWIVDWRTQMMAVDRHAEGRLRLVGTLTAADTLTSPLLPAFRLSVAELFPQD